MNDIEFLCQESAMATDDGLPETGKQLESIAIRLARLIAIVDKLPKTKDGVPVVPNVDSVWCVFEGQVLKLNAWVDDGRVSQYADWDNIGYVQTEKSDKYVNFDPSECYSTKEVAAYALENT